MILKKAATDFEDRFEKYLRGELTYEELHRERSRAKGYGVKITFSPPGKTKVISIIPLRAGRFR